MESRVIGVFQFNSYISYVCVVLYVSHLGSWNLSFTRVFPDLILQKNMSV